MVVSAARICSSSISALRSLLGYLLAMKCLSQPIIQKMKPSAMRWRMTVYRLGIGRLREWHPVGGVSRTIPRMPMRAVVVPSGPNLFGIGGQESAFLRRCLYRLPLAHACLITGNVEGDESGEAWLKLPCASPSGVRPPGSLLATPARSLFCLTEASVPPAFPGSTLVAFASGLSEGGSVSGMVGSDPPSSAWGGAEIVLLLMRHRACARDGRGLRCLPFRGGRGARYRYGPGTSP